MDKSDAKFLQQILQLILFVLFLSEWRDKVCIDLSCLDVGMPKHFTDAFNRYPLGKRNCCSKCVSRNVECQQFINPVEIGNFFQVMGAFPLLFSALFLM